MNAGAPESRGNSLRGGGNASIRLKSRCLGPPRPRRGCIGPLFRLGRSTRGLRSATVRTARRASKALSAAKPFTGPPKGGEGGNHTDLREPSSSRPRVPAIPSPVRASHGAAPARRSRAARRPLKTNAAFPVSPGRSGIYAAPAAGSGPVSPPRSLPGRPARPADGAEALSYACVWRPSRARYGGSSRKAGLARSRPLQ